MYDNETEISIILNQKSQRSWFKSLYCMYKVKLPPHSSRPRDRSKVFLQQTRDLVLERRSRIRKNVVRHKKQIEERDHQVYLAARSTSSYCWAAWSQLKSCVMPRC